MVYTQDLGRPALAEVAPADDPRNLPHQVCLGEGLVRFPDLQVGKQVPTAFRDLHHVAHFSFLPICCKPTGEGSFREESDKTCLARLCGNAMFGEVFPFEPLPELGRVV